MMSARRTGLATAVTSLLVMLMSGCATSTPPAGEQAASAASEAGDSVELTTSDGVTVYGDLHRSEGARSLLLLFHQAGADGRSEYDPLLPRLKEAGYDALVIDQRVGGSRFGGVNRTALGAAGTEYGYCDAYPDLEAALDYATSLDTGLPIIAWGSSYSAALVVRLATDHPGEMAGILSFSPASGEPLKDCDPLEISADVSIPALFLRPASEMENERVAQQLETLGEQGHRTYVADPGVHGSSMLNSSRVEGDVEATWEVVLGFLATVTSGA